MPTAYHPSYDSFLAPPPWNRFEDIRRPLWARGVGGGGETEIVVPEWAQDSVLFLDSQYSASGEPRVINRGTGDRTGVSGAVIYNGAAVLPGVAGNYLSVPSAADLQLGDFEMAVRVKVDDWAGGFQGLVSKDSSTSYEFMKVGGSKSIRVGLHGTTLASSVVSEWENGVTYWVKVAATMDNGAGASQATFYWAADQATEPTTWTTINTATGAVETRVTGTSAVIIGARDSSQFPLDGTIYRTIIRDGIDGTTVLDVDLTNVPNWTGPTFTATTGQTVTLNTTAADYGAPSALDAKYGSVLGAYVYDGAAVFNKNGDELSIPHQASFNFAGDVEFVWRGSFSDFSTWQTIVSKRNASLCWQLYLRGNAIAADAKIAGVDYSGVGSININTLPGVTTGTPYWYRWRRVASTGTISLEYAVDQPAEPTSWTSLGTNSSATGAFTSNSDVVQIGVNRASSEPYGGSINRVVLRDGIDGSTVLDVDLANVADYATSFTATTGQTVTVNSTSSDTNDPLLLTHTGENYVYMPGSAGTAGECCLWSANKELTPSTAVVSTRLKWGSTQTARTLMFYMKDEVLTSGADVFTWNILADGEIRANIFGSAGVNQSFNGMFYDPELVGRPGRTVRLDMLPTAGEFRAYWSDDDGDTWTEADNSPFTTGVTPWTWDTHTAHYMVGGDHYEGSSIAFNGKVVYAEVLHDGVSAFRIDPANITDAGATSFTATTGQTVNVDRATSGRKTALVTRPVWLFGTDDFLEVADNALLDFTGSIEMTLLAVWRDFSTTNGQVVSKSGNSISAGAYRLTISSDTGSRYDIGVAGGSALLGVNPARVAGELNAATMLRDGTDFIRHLNGETPLSSSDTLFASDISNALPFRVGGAGDGSQPMDMELVAVAVWRRVLTADEITAINQYYGTV